MGAELGPSLAELQQHLAAAIAKGAATDPAIARHFAPPPRGSLEDRLRVYALGYRARVEEALSATFPAVAHILGPRSFSELVHRYAGHIPAGSYNLNSIGSALPHFLGRDILSHRLPFLSDLARLEWYVWRVFHAPRREPLDARALAHLRPGERERAVFVLQPSVALLLSPWPIGELWRTRHTPAAQIDIEVCGKPDRVLIYRRNFDVACESVPEDEAFLLHCLIARMPLGRALARAARRGLNPDRTAELFARWARLEVFWRVTVAEDNARQGKAQALAERP